MNLNGKGRMRRWMEGMGEDGGEGGCNVWERRMEWMGDNEGEGGWKGWERM